MADLEEAARKIQRWFKKVNPPCEDCGSYNKRRPGTCYECYYYDRYGPGGWDTSESW